MRHAWTNTPGRGRVLIVWVVGSPVLLGLLCLWLFFVSRVQPNLYLSVLVPATTGQATITWALSRWAGERPLPWFLYVIAWGNGVFFALPGFGLGTALVSIMTQAYQYAGHNATSLQTVSAVVGATFTVLYVLCTVALVRQGQVARASQDRAAREQVKVQEHLAAEQARTNASLAASLAALTQLLEAQKAAQPGLPPPAQPSITVMSAPPPDVVLRPKGRVQKAWRELRR